MVVGGAVAVGGVGDKRWDGLDSTTTGEEEDVVE